MRFTPFQERQEKALGILTYLGQSAAEAQSGRPWYQELPERCEVVKDEKLKGKLDPLLEMEKHLRKKKGAHSKEGKKEKGEQRQKDSRRNLALGCVCLGKGEANTHSYPYIWYWQSKAGATS